MGISKTLLLSAMLPMAVAVSGSVLAQGAAPAGAKTGDSDQIDEIIVTARKREERLQDVPVAITALTTEDIERYATGSVTDLAEQTPELKIGGANGPAGSVINMRGVGSSTVSPSIDQAVSVNIDGIQVSQANSLQLGIYDLERVEILRGPQALFFGKNSTAGVISLVSANPADSMEWRLRTGFEALSERKSVEGMISGPINDQWKFRIAAAASDQKGWFRNESQALAASPGARTRTSPDQNELFVRGTLAYKSAGEQFDANLKVSYGSQKRDNGIVAGAQLFACAFGVPLGSFGLPGASTDCMLDRRYLEADFSTGATATAPSFYRDGRPYYENDVLLSALTANWHLTPTLTLTSVSGYLDTDEQWTTNFSSTDVEWLVTGARTKQRQTTQELRLTSSFSAPVNFMLGGFYQNADLDLAIPSTISGPIALGFLGSPAPTLVSYDTFKQSTDAYSLFGQLIWELSPQFELSAGARYSHEKKSETGARLPSALSGGFTLPYAFARPEVSFNNVSSDFTVTYKAADNVSLYVAYREGFTSGGFNLVPISLSVNPASPSANSFNEATVAGEEAGIRGSLLDRHIHFDFTLYRYVYNDMQLSVFDPSTAALQTVNAGSARVQGAEWSAKYEPAGISGVAIRAAANYNDARFRRFINAGCYAAQSVGEGCVAGSQDLSGAPLERAPKWSGNLGLSYEHHLSNGMAWGLSGDASFTGSYQSHPQQDPRGLQDAAWRYNAGITFSGHDKAWEIALIGKNLGNKLRVLAAYTNPFSDAGGTLRGDLAGSVSEPRSVLLQVTFRN